MSGKSESVYMGGMMGHNSFQILKLSLKKWKDITNLSFRVLV